VDYCRIVVHSYKKSEWVVEIVRLVDHRKVRAVNKLSGLTVDMRLDPDKPIRPQTEEFIESLSDTSSGAKTAPRWAM